VLYVENVADVFDLVGALKYRPLKGEKLKMLLSGKEKPTAKLEAYLKIYHNNHTLLLNIESPAGANNMENFIAIQTVDGQGVGGIGTLNKSKPALIGWEEEQVELNLDLDSCVKASSLEITTLLDTKTRRILHPLLMECFIYQKKNEGFESVGKIEVKGNQRKGKISAPIFLRFQILRNHFVLSN
jgi:hypothetical protein